MRVFIIMLAVLIVPIGNINAQDNTEFSSKTFDELLKCREIIDSAERLACFDSKSNALAKAKDSEEIIVADKESVEKTKKGLFGLSLPKLKLFGNTNEKALKQINSTIASASEQRGGKWLLILEDGAKWLQTERKILPFNPKPGMKVRIKRAAIGTFLVNIAGQRAIRMKRIN